MNVDELSMEEASLIVAHDEANTVNAVVPPIIQTSLFTFSSYEEMVSTYRGEITRPVYTRGLNPTVRAFETMLAKLEEADDAIGFSSGMAAIASAALSFVKPGDRIVAVRHIYPDAFRLFGTFVARMGIDVAYVDGQDEAAVRQALPGAKLFYMESPTSWVMETHDAGALASLAKEYGVLTIIDNSWATPIFQKPLSLGVDLVVHSASKYLGGHSDVVAGVVAGSRDLIGRIRAEAYPYLGGKLSPFDAWLLLRGMRTLPIRMQAHQAAALSIANRLQAHEKVDMVCHPALAGALPPGLTGTSGLFSFVFGEGVDVGVFCNSLQYFKLGVSWGGHESLVIPGEVVLQQKAQPNAAQVFGINGRSVRLHVGLEGTQALWGDLEQAITKASAQMP